MNEDFVDLDRSFVPVEKDVEGTFEWGPSIGRELGGWLSWADLLQTRRVVILAEAQCGKTREIENQCKQLSGQSRAAFFVRIEDLAEHGFEALSNGDDSAMLKRWSRSSTEQAWFFLDSVDEARINGKRFDNALKSLRTGLGVEGLARAFLVITCRVSDWFHRSDRGLIQETLPFIPLVEPTATTLTDEEFLAPVFDRGTREAKPKQRTHPEPSELLVVKLVPLDREQQGKLAKSRDVDSESFLHSLYREGLAHLAERPGDLLELIDSWIAKSGFSNLATMMEEGISRKLKEKDYRRDTSELTPKRAREGVERLAGAMTFGKSFSLQAPGAEPDPKLPKDAIDPYKVLEDWAPASVRALVRTGLFAPATYGRIRFHHRTTQEFLTASWLNVLLKNNCSVRTVKSLLFTRRYGVDTVVNGMSAVAAWLSQWSTDVRDELIQREPILLIVHGDPRSLPLAARSRLLEAYARLDAQGEMLHEVVDDRAAWMFSNPELAPDIHRAWLNNTRWQFREQLAKFVELGRVTACLDLLKDAVLNPLEPTRLRLACVSAISACGDIPTQRKLARLFAQKDVGDSYFLAQLAAALFPTVLSGKELVKVVRTSWASSVDAREAIARHLPVLHGLGKTRLDQQRLVDTVGELLLPEGLNAVPWVRDSCDRHELDDGVASLAVYEIESCGYGEVAQGVLRLLIGIEQARHSYMSDTPIEKLMRLVRQNTPLNRQLFWVNEGIARRNDPTAPPVALNHVGIYRERCLCALGVSDFEWLMNDARRKSLSSQRRVAFDGAFRIAHLQADAAEKMDALAALASSDPMLLADFNELTTPRPPHEYELRERKSAAKHRAKEKKAKQSWLDFRDELKAAPGALDKPGTLSTWSGAQRKLHYLTNWLLGHSRSTDANSVAAWPALVERGINKQVSEHYERGMRLAWREIPPERPKSDGSMTTTKAETRLAILGLEIESLSDGWADKLNEREAIQALRHVVLAGRIRSTYARDLIRARPRVAVPIVQAAVREEIASKGSLWDILQAHAFRHADRDEEPLAREVSQVVFEAFTKNEPKDEPTFEKCYNILNRRIQDFDKKSFQSLIQRRLAAHLKSGEEATAFRYLGLLSKLDAGVAAELVLGELAQRPNEEEGDWHKRAQVWIGALFENRGQGGHALALLDSVSVAFLHRLVKLAYLLVHRNSDLTIEEEGRECNYVRRNAETGRSALLTALWERPGEDAYRALQSLAMDEHFEDLAHRLKEQAHKKAQTDSNFERWTEAESYGFNERKLAPVKTGKDLMKLTIDILDEVGGTARQADASTWSLLAKADVEEEVQEWLYEQLKNKSKDRYQPHRETQVADNNAPDIVLSALGSPVEIAIEVKHGNKLEWTFTTLKRAIKSQLAEKYLLPDDRRHGMFIISLHKDRQWKVNGQDWDFVRLIENLKEYAKTVTTNRRGSVEIEVFGIDARTGDKPAKKPRKAAG